MLQEKLTEALINKAREEQEDELIYSKACEQKSEEADSEVGRMYYETLARLGEPKKKKPKTVASKAYRIAKADGFSTKQCSRIGLLFLSYNRGQIDFSDLCNKAGLSETDIMNKYGDALY